MFPRWIVPEIKRSQCPKLPPNRSCNAEGRVMMLVRRRPLPRRDSKIFEGYHVCWQLYREMVFALVLDLLCSCRSSLRRESGALKPEHGASFDCRNDVLFAWVWS